VREIFIFILFLYADSNGGYIDDNSVCNDNAMPSSGLKGMATMAASCCTSSNVNDKSTTGPRYVLFLLFSPYLKSQRRQGATTAAMTVTDNRSFADNNRPPASSSLARSRPTPNQASKTWHPRYVPIPCITKATPLHAHTQATPTSKTPAKSAKKMATKAQEARRRSRRRPERRRTRLTSTKVSDSLF
jgi:hypothetical protein